MKTIKNKVKQHKGKLTTDLFRNEAGAIDLASIMVGVIVIGLIGGTVAATVFAVIPWTQDNAAKQQLDSIASAESAYMGLSSATPSPLPAGYAPNSFGNSAQLKAANLLQPGPNYCAVTPADGKSYTGYSKSSSGSVWVMSDKNTKPAILTDPVPVECGFTLASATDPVASPTASPTATVTPTATPTPSETPYVDPTPTITKLTFKCDTTVYNGNIPMNGNLTGTEKWSDGLTRSYTNAAGASTRNFTAGTTYTVTFDGTYNSMNSYYGGSAGSISCLRSVDYWGTGTGVTNATQAFYMATNLTDVPAHIPTTITNMVNFFRGASQINDPDISKWDTSNVTTMSAMFYGATNFNQSLNSWNVTNVKDMSSMFSSATSFNGDITGWNIKATTLSSMFSGATSFNQPIGKWNTTTVTNLSSMFSGANTFNQDLSIWNTSNVTSLSNMFAGAKAFNQPLNSWDTSNVTNMMQVFSSNSFNQPLDNWKTSKVTTMANLFYNNNAFNQPLSNWDTSNVTTMSGMFGLNSAFNQDLSSWNTTKVTDMSKMFLSASSFNQDLSGWNTSNVTNMGEMFSSATSFNYPVNSWNVSNVKDMHLMFRSTKAFNQPLNNWNTLNVTDMSNMFNDADAFNQPLNTFNTSNVTTMNSMFYGNDAFNQPLNSWNTSNVQDMAYMFYNAKVFNQNIKSTWNVSKVTSYANFRTGSALTTTNSPF